MEQSLIEQVVARVIQKVQENEGAPAGECPQCCADNSTGKPGLLILTQDHGEHGHQMLESARLKERFATSCALMADYNCDLTGIDTVIIYQFTIDAMSKLASGICDTPYLQLLSQALLTGKHIYVPKEEVELFDYVSTAPAVYYAMLEEKLRVLTASGLVVCPKADMEDVILGSAPAPKPACCTAAAAPAGGKPAPAGKEQRLEKRAITEQDLFVLKKDGVDCVRVKANAILTDLAKEFVKTNSMTILRG